MRYLKYFLHVLFICFILTGCQKTDNKMEEKSLSKEHKSKDNEMNEKKVQSGDKITIALTEGMMLDAIIEMPDIASDEVNLYQVIAQRYNGQELIKALIGEIPKNMEVIDRGTEEYGYHYFGNLGEQWGNVNGSIIADEDAYIETNHWNEISEYFPIFYMGSEIQIMIESQREEPELFSITLDEISNQVGKYLKEICGFEDVVMYQAYSFDWEQLKMTQENFLALPENEQAKPNEMTMRDWNEEDNCYWMFFEQTIDQIPVLTHYINRQDDLYIPSSVTQVGYSNKGIEFIQFGQCYEILEKKEAKLVNIQEIYRTLQKKFEMTIVESGTIDQMKLIYYPLSIEKNENGRWICDMIPTWQFRIRENEYTDYIYINAVDNIELIG